jgi:hypothetical protein
MSEVIHLFRPIASRDCDGCGEAHHEPGTLCKVCRARQAAVPTVFIASSAASVISDLERWERQGHPLAGPLADALKNARQLYDAVGPRVQDAAPGEIHYLEGECWAFPRDADGVQLGPFPNAEAAEAALVEFAANKPPVEDSILSNGPASPGTKG